jgi:hypothetical protein
MRVVLTIDQGVVAHPVSSGRKSSLEQEKESEPKRIVLHQIELSEGKSIDSEGPERKRCPFWLSV